MKAPVWGFRALQEGGYAKGAYIYIYVYIYMYILYVHTNICRALQWVDEVPRGIPQSSPAPDPQQISPQAPA